MQIKGL